MSRPTTTLVQADIRRVVIHLPRDVQALLKEHSLFVAGGFIRSVISNEQPSDIDLFGADKDKLHEVALKLALSRKARLHETENAYTVLTPGRTPVQFIHRWLYSEPSQLLEEFDYTIARSVAWWHEDRWHSLCDACFYADLAARRLVYCKPVRQEDVGGSLMRARKFLSRGYFISATDLGLVVARLMSGVDLDRAQASRVDLEQIVIGLLHEVDPLTVVDGIDVADEHASVPVES
jgi:hypothetical protein